MPVKKMIPQAAVQTPQQNFRNRTAQPQKAVRFVITERFIGKRNPADIFTDIVVSEFKGETHTWEPQNGIIEPPTIPKSVVPKERS